ncbi:MAG TPA: purine-nucleoside phosphorylase [Acidimicrobiales bacterium]|nr:purine-nucleoside phosphorylase [Acidimicrobiales bacterium]
MALEDPFALAERASREVLAWSGGATPRVAVVLGSGWLPAADSLGAAIDERPTTGLSGFPVPTVAGHHGALRRLEIGGSVVLVLVGRVHLYEGRTEAEVVHAVRTAVLAGCDTVILTNAAGSIRAEWGPGTAVAISDHLNLTNRSPLSGDPPPEPFSSRFVDLSAVYSPRLRNVAREVSPELREGVYAALRGPHYETPAEIRMLRTIGADLVGMSTALEAIAARHLGAEVLGLSLVTNLAAGVSATPLDHLEVLAAGAEAAPGLGRLLRGVIERL